MPSATRRLQLLAWLSFCHDSSCFHAVSLKPALSSFRGTTFYLPSPSTPRARAAKVAASSSRSPFALNAHRQVQQPSNKNSNNHNEIDGDKTIQNDASFLALLNRRHFLAAAAAVISSSSLFIPALVTHAGALLQFPVGPETQVLKNKYHFMRAGISDLEEQGIYSTNALFLTNRENAMNVEKGEPMVLQALDIIKRSNAQLYYPTVTYHSLAANGMDTGDLIARELKLGREKLLPEFTYLDQRGVGLWDAGDESIVKPAIWALDYAEAGKFGIAEKSRPPANNDGTPNETLGDQFVRLRQFLSLQESRTSGETILVIFPDGTGPALLSCMIAGIPFRDVHALEFRPGEVRLDITPESVRALFETRKDDPEYLAILQDGKEKLALLRQQQKESPSTFVGLKEQMAEKERLEIDEAFETKKRTDATRKMERQRVIQEAREEKTKKQRQFQEEKERERNERASANAAAALALKSASSTNVAKAVSTSSGGGSSRSLGLGSSSIMAAAAVGVLGLGMVAMATSGNDKENENDKEVTVPTPRNMETSATSVANGKEEKSALPPPATKTTETKSSLYAKTITPLTARSPRDEEEQTPAPTLATNTSDDSRSSTTPSRYSLADEDVIDESSSLLVDSDIVIQEQLNQLVAAEQAMKDALTGAASSSSSNNNNNVELDDEPYEDDDAWLRVLADIRDEEEDENEFLNGDAKKTAADFDLIVINGDGRKKGPSASRSADL